MKGHREKPHEGPRSHGCAERTEACEERTEACGERTETCGERTEACGEMAELLSARLDGELGGEEAALLDEHLLACGDCRSLADRLEAVDAVVALGGIEPRAGLEEELEARIAGAFKS